MEIIKTVKTIAIAESCTGGLVSHLITNKSGSSQYFKLGIVAYSKEAKIFLLNISPQIIKRFGSVSREVALLMAQRIKDLAKTDIGLGISGIAGPCLPNGEEEKPVGLVYIAVFSAKGHSTEEFNFKGSRQEIKQKTAEKALRILKEKSEEKKDCHSFDSGLADTAKNIRRLGDSGE